MAEMTPEKIAAQEEADQKTDWERQRMDYYLGLRYNFSICNVDDWIETLYAQNKVDYIPQKDPSWNQVRKESGIGFWENIFAFLSEEKKRALDARKAEVRKRLQANVDKANADEHERCSAYNSRLSEQLKDRLDRLTAHDTEEVEEYFTFALNQDSYALDGEEFRRNYSLSYKSPERQLIVEYRLPSMDEVPRTKEWKVNKNNDVVSKEMTKTDYLEMYERILFDLAMRTVGIIFESDSNNVVSSIVFNGSCVYHRWQDKPTVLLSFIIPKLQFSNYRIEKMDFVSKTEIAKLHDVRYIGDINSQKPPAELWETPPTKLIVPFKSSL